LLDWTDGLLISLFFAVYELTDNDIEDSNTEHPCVWLLNPLELNYVSTGNKKYQNRFNYMIEILVCGILI
jgi:hypothetical protein